MLTGLSVRVRRKAGSILSAILFKKGEIE